MVITDIQITLVPNPGRLLAFANIIIEHCFLIKDIKIIQGSKFIFISMPSRKVLDHCMVCGAKNHLLAKFCNECGTRLSRESAEKPVKLKLHSDIAHPLNAQCRQEFQKIIIKAFQEEVARSKQPGYVPSHFEDLSLKDDDIPTPTPLHGLPAVALGRGKAAPEPAGVETPKKEEEREREIALKLLHLIGSSDNTTELMRNLIAFLKEQLDCDVVAIRLGRGEDFPYFSHTGISEDGAKSDESLCVVNSQGQIVRDGNGRAVLECACGKVLSGQVDPANSCFTVHGSFWTNSIGECLAKTSEAEKQTLRKNCWSGAFQSLALVPLRAGGQICGLLQLGAKRPGAFAPELVSFLESLAENLAAFLAQRKAENALNEAERLLAAEKAANNAKDVFIAMLSHELRVPLCSILVWVKMLLSDRLNETATAKGLKVIERNAKAQNQLIDDLLDISRIVTGKLKLRLRPLKLRPVIEAALDAVAPLAKAKDVQLNSHYDDGSVHVSGDPVRLQQIIWNLLTNAIKFTPKGGRVDLWMDRSPLGGQPEMARIRVSDTGAGVPASLLPHIFDRFFQAENQLARGYTGLGLGLTIVRYLVQEHHGAVTVESAGEFQGATFTVCLPVVAAPATQELKHAKISHKPAHGSFECHVRLDGVRVLVVDDDQDSLDWLSIIFKHCGAEIKTAASAMEAFKEFERQPPQVLICDIGMPLEDGYSLIRRIRRLDKADGGEVPALALTVYSREEDRIMAINAGFQAHLTKPTEPHELAKAVAELTQSLARP
jgi:signal transduction histidine kinase/DNA-binding cell septation regulator SpoVG/ActR/RegA family two-component response regulator